MEKNRLLHLAGVLNEASDYSDSTEFTEDYTNLLQNIDEMNKLVLSKKWNNWIKVTDKNYDTNLIDINDKLKSCLKSLKQISITLEHEMDKAG